MENPDQVTFSEGEWQALLARTEHIQKEVSSLKYDLLLWARKAK